MKDELKDKDQNAKQKTWWKTLFSVFLMLVWVFCSIVASQYIVGYIMLWMIGAENFIQPVPTAIYSALAYVLAMLLIIFAPKLLAKKWGLAGKLKAKSTGKEARDSERIALGLNGWPTWTDVGLAPAGFVVYLMLAAGLAGLFSLFPWFDAEQVQEVGFSVYVTGFDRVVAFIVLVIIAPVAEEIIFRGWLYDKLRGKFLENYSDAISIVVSNLLVSVLFGIVHMQWNVGVNVFAMSVVLCALREITGTIYAGILLHMLKNGIAFYLLYVLGIT